MIVRPLDPWCGVIVEYEDTRVFVDVNDRSEPRVKRADVVIVTHPHRDHYGGVPKVTYRELRADDVTAALLGLEDTARRMRRYFEAGLLDARTYPVNHMCPEARAVLLHGDAIVLVTGDWCALGEHPPLWESVDDDVDVLVTECTRALDREPDDPEAEAHTLQRLLETHRDGRTVLLLNDVNPLVEAASEVETLHVLRDDPAVRAVEAGAHGGADVVLVEEPRYPLLTSDPGRALELRPHTVITERWFLYRDEETVGELLRGTPHAYVVSGTGHATLGEIVRLVEELKPRHTVLRHGGNQTATTARRALERTTDTEVHVWVGRKGGKLTL